jgi:hypothetical protein
VLCVVRFTGESVAFCNICDQDIISTEKSYYMCTHVNCITTADTDRSFDAHGMCAKHLSSAAKELLYTGVLGLTPAETVHHRLHHTEGAHREGMKRVTNGAQRLPNDWTGPSVSEACGSQMKPPSQLPLASTSPGVQSPVTLVRTHTAPPIDPSVVLNRSHVAVSPTPVPITLSTGSDQEPVIEMDPTQVTMMEAVDRVTYDMLNESTNQSSTPVPTPQLSNVYELTRSIRKAGISMNSPSLFTDAHHQSQSTRMEEPLQLERAMEAMSASSVSKRLQFDAAPLAENPPPAVSLRKTVVRSPSTVSTSSDVTSSAAESYVDSSMTSVSSLSKHHASSSSDNLARDWKVITYVPSAFIVLELHGIPDGLPPMKVIMQWLSMFPEYERQTEVAQRGLRNRWMNFRAPAVTQGDGSRHRVARAAWNKIYDTNPAAIQYIQDHLTSSVINEMAVMHNSTVGCQPGQQMVDVITVKTRSHISTIEWSREDQVLLTKRYEDYIGRRAENGHAIQVGSSAGAPVNSQQTTVQQPIKTTHIASAMEVIEVRNANAERKKKKQKTEP